MWTMGDGELPAVGSRSVRGLSAEQLPCVFQPIVSVSNGALFAYEALVRCTDPAFASPLALFEHAVSESSCGRLGRVIRESAFARCPDTPIFVNLHPHELVERWLVRPDDPLCFHEQTVYLEITEAATIEYYDLCLSTLKEVCARSGAHLVVDDFGAGYSNMMRVLDLEPSVIKLDRALVNGVDEVPRKQRMVRHVVEMCRDLGARVVAEGIETVPELRAMRELGVDYVQGYLLGRPAFPPPKPGWPL
jgi:EAL domain-containing protein (putative c-di-GMP-specific phosphodiesterase class I)